MSTRKLRLDEILVREGLISEEQIRDALMRQKAHGGKFGSQLLYHRYIDETGLVKALAVQFQCEGVVLSNLQIPEAILKLIPARVAIARKVVPFDYDEKTSLLKVACEDPADQSLIDELNFVASGRQVKLYVAAEIVLNTVVARYYMGRDISLDDNLLLEIPDAATETGKVPTQEATAAEPVAGAEHLGSVLLVTDEEYSGPLLQSLLERDNYQVTVMNSADDAIEIIGDRRFHSVLIKDTVAGDYIDLIDRLRKISPRTRVRYYGSSSSLLLGDDALAAAEELLLKNLELFTSLVASKENLPSNHSGRVGLYVERLCRRLGLPEKERMTIANAGYLHDLAKYYYRSANYRETIGLTVKLLRSINYSPVIIEMLRSMYIDLKSKYTKRLPVEVLGGNIITIVDLFCDNIPPEQKLSLDKFDAVKKKLRDLTGRLFLTEVVEAFVQMIQEEILNIATVERSSQIMIFSDEPGALYPAELRLKNEGFRIISESSAERFIVLYERSRPDIIVLFLQHEPDDIIAFVEYLADHGVDFKQMPVFLLADPRKTSRLTCLLERGIEDIIASDGSYDLLVVKLRKIDESLKEKAMQKDELKDNATGAMGRLADMNLIDLVQALGPSRKTVKIVVKSNVSPDRALEMYLERGNIRHARLNELAGAEAVYEAITWSDGNWTIEPVESEKLPTRNTDLSNESILMEGCRLLDERTRAGELT